MGFGPRLRDGHRCRNRLGPEPGELSRPGPGHVAAVVTIGCGVERRIHISTEVQPIMGGNHPPLGLGDRIVWIGRRPPAIAIAGFDGYENRHVNSALAQRFDHLGKSAEIILGRGVRQEIGLALLNEDVSAPARRNPPRSRDARASCRPAPIGRCLFRQSR